MLDFLSTLFQSLAPLWEMSVTAAYAAAIVIVLRLLLKRRAPRQVLCLLWLVVFARLLIPVSLESPLSIVPGAQQVQFAQELPSKLAGGGQTHSTQNQNHNPIQNQTPEQTGGQAGGVTVNPVSHGNSGSVPTLTLPEGAAPPAPQPEAPAPGLWQAALAGVWLAGAAALAFYALFSYFRLRRCLFDAIRARDGAWEHPAVNSPFILGVLRPRIYLPAGLSGQPRQFILCHERAHLRRLDHIVKPVCWIALALHWFNPMVWAAYILMSRDIEAACDEAVIRRLGPKVKADYSATLLALATNGRVPAPCPLAFDEGNAKGRIKNVLRYRRPALWIVVVSVIAAVLAAVCLLTDPVAAKEPDADPSPDASASQPLANLADTLLDSWMKEVLDGERLFARGGDMETEQFSINQLRDMVYRDEHPDLILEVGKLAVIDLDRDGVNEMVVWPVGGEPDDPTEIGYTVGYFIFRRQGDKVTVHYAGWRPMQNLKADGTFEWSSSAWNWGISRLIDIDTFETEEITWKDTPGVDDDNYFVDGLKATKEEFEAAYDAQQAKPDPVWYVYEDGVLKYAPINVPIPLDEYAQAAPVPDFLDEELQLLYRQAYTMYDHIFGPNTEEVDNWPGGGGYGSSDVVERNGWGYVPATGLYRDWNDFEEAVLSVFTPNYWQSRNYILDSGTTPEGAALYDPLYTNIGGQLHYVSAARGNMGNNTYFPETFQLVQRTENLIFFVTTAYYRERPDDVPVGGWDAYLRAGWDYSLEFPIRMVKTENGWRFDEFYCPMTDDNGRFQQIPNPDKVPNLTDPYSIYTAAPLSAPVVDLMNGLPDDPEEWYKVAELPDDMIWVFSRNDGAETLIRWDGNFYKVFDQRAHTARSIPPQLKKLGGPDTYGPLAVISNVGSGTGVSLDRLVVYDLDASDAPSYVHDWSLLRDEFNAYRTFQYDGNTHTITCTYEGQTAELIIDGGDEMFRRIDEEGIGLRASGLVVSYRFNEDGTIQIEFPLEAFIGDDVVNAPLIWPWFLRWTIRFDSERAEFETVPGSCELFTYAGQ